MVRRGSPVRVRKRACRKPPLRGLFLSPMAAASSRKTGRWKVLESCAPGRLAWLPHAKVAGAEELALHALDQLVGQDAVVACPAPYRHPEPGRHRRPNPRAVDLELLPQGDIRPLARRHCSDVLHL